ncbi:hypothetical protein I601_3000 [Nocardioides dokdonensis FR1436]|uniref:DUF1206 domain-containing protein n=1 Tax=Nocardioides dokdonensis FR1436 TaxID=1300347 RepID=A0A1A9GPK6_9ACTN|nr:DUF1206 domain-containing protein [Nocardioides dokdonensis]ANH39411.1 hypothetical protein I601_3000 [Nocardioides dokdonensis FR1436]
MGNASDLGKKAEDHAWVDHAARAGMVAYGVVNVLIAWLALQLAFGDREGSTTSSGAMSQLAQQPFGKVLVWLVAVGMLLLVVWKGLEAAFGHTEEDSGKKTGKRLTSGGKAVIYLAIAISAIRVATGSSSSGGGGKGGGGTDSTTRTLMDLPGGQVLVFLVGLAIIGYGIFQIYFAWSEKFRDHITSEGERGSSGTAYVAFGKAGYTAKGIAVGIVGGLFLYASVTHSAKKSGGLDVALQKVLEQPFGPFLLAVLAVGILAYGLFCFARARHLSR